MQLPAAVADWIEAEACAFSMRDLKSAAEEISARYRAERPRTGRLTASECAAWMTVRLPATWAATAAVLQDLRRVAPALEPLSLLDLGAGPGGGLHAASQVFASLERVAAMEQDPAFLAAGARMAGVSEYAAVHSARWLERDIRTGPPFPQHDLVLLGWVAGELESAARQTLFARAWAAAAAVLIVIEPGTPRGFEVVREARREL